MPVLALVSMKNAACSYFSMFCIFSGVVSCYRSALVPTKKNTISSWPCSRTYLCQVRSASNDSSLSSANVKKTPAIPL